MLLGNILTIIISFTIGFFAFKAAFLWKHFPTRFRSVLVRIFCLFWFILGIVWVLTGTVGLLRYFFYEEIAISLTYILQIFLGLALVVGGVFAEEAFFAGKRRAFVVSLYVGFYALFLYALFVYGVYSPEEQFFANHITTSIEHQIIFIVMFIPIWISTVVLYVQHSRKKKELDPRYYSFYRFALFSLILLGLAGGIDELGFVQDWMVTAARLGSLIAVLIAYASLTALQDSEELVI